MGFEQKKRYIFVSNTNFESGKLTGAHKRFLELVKSISKNEEVSLVTYNIPQLFDCKNITFYKLEKQIKYLPDHIAGMVSICKALKKNKIVYDYAISFGPISTICYKLCGYKNIISLFREDIVGYQEAIGASKCKVRYFHFQEIIAVYASDKIIVQCENDKKSLIDRNRKYCKNIEKKVYVQINNANASWMNTEEVEHYVDNEKTTILFIGDFSNKRKGHGILLPAIKKLIDEGRNIQLLVAGDGMEFNEYKEQYVDYHDIIFLGRVDNMSQYLKLSDFMVVPSFIDSCPNTVLEGLNAGIAVYGANSGGIPDLLSDSEFLFETTKDGIYCFLKKIIDEKRYKKDRVNQKIRKRELTFDWGDGIRKIIVSNSL